MTSKNKTLKKKITLTRESLLRLSVADLRQVGGGATSPCSDKGSCYVITANC